MYSILSDMTCDIKYEEAERNKFIYIFYLTVPISSVRNLNVYDIGSTYMRVRWEPLNGATGYLLTYEPVNATVPVAEKEVREFVFATCTLPKIN